MKYNMVFQDYVPFPPANFSPFRKNIFPEYSKLPFPQSGLFFTWYVKCITFRYIYLHKNIPVNLPEKKE